MLRCFSIGSSRSRRKADDALEAVSEQQISHTCLAVYVKAGCVWLAFADGRHDRVDTHLAVRSPLLQCALESAGGKSEYLQHRERIFHWHQYVSEMDLNADNWDASSSTLTILRQLLVRTFLCPCRTLKPTVHTCSSLMAVFAMGTKHCALWGLIAAPVWTVQRFYLHSRAHSVPLCSSASA